MKQHINSDQCIFSSLSRITDFNQGFEIEHLDRKSWEDGDYVLCKVIHIGGSKVRAELTNGRMMEFMEGDLILGALGVRHATLEATGTWEKVGPDGTMQILTGAGLMGKMTSRSMFITPLIDVQYMGHPIRNGRKLNMTDFAANPEIIPFEVPVILFFGTSMSSGKTTSARILTRLLKQLNLKVTAAKLTGAGRYRDILTIKDAGADNIYDFVDVGLSSSICPASKYNIALTKMLSLIQSSNPHVAVIEIGASPLEPYNGDAAIEVIRDHIACIVLCASDPYAVLGVMQSFELKPDIVTGPATNTIGGIELIQKLCKVRALNLLEKRNLPELKRIVQQKLCIGIPVE